MRNTGKGTRSMWKGLLAVLAVMIALVGAAVTTEAASASAAVDSEGNMVIKNASGKEVKRFSPGTGAHFVGQTAGSGNYVAFTRYIEVGSSGKTNCLLYRYNVKTGELESAKLPTGFYAYDVDEYYDGCIYLTGWNPSDNAVGYRFYPDTVKMVEIANGGVMHRYKNYFVLDSTRVHGSFVPYNVYVYNAKTDQVRTAMKKVGAYTVIGKYIYAAVLRNKNGLPENGTAYRIVRYNMTNGSKKTLVSSMKGYMVDRVTSKYVYSRRITGSKVIFYRYSIKTKKNVKLTAARYKKATNLQ